MYHSALDEPIKPFPEWFIPSSELMHHMQLDGWSWPFIPKERILDNSQVVIGWLCGRIGAVLTRVFNERTILSLALTMNYGYHTLKLKHNFAPSRFDPVGLISRTTLIEGMAWKLYSLRWNMANFHEVEIPCVSRFDWLLLSLEKIYYTNAFANKILTSALVLCLPFLDI